MSADARYLLWLSTTLLPAMRRGLDKGILLPYEYHAAVAIARDVAGRLIGKGA